MNFGSKDKLIIVGFQFQFKSSLSFNQKTSHQAQLGITATDRCYKRKTS